jgi:hypothetical protein
MHYIDVFLISRIFYPVCIFKKGGGDVTDKELNKLKRSELLELLFAFREEIDRLREENELLRKRADDTDANREILEKILFAVCPEEQQKEHEQ